MENNEMRVKSSKLYEVPAWKNEFNFRVFIVRPRINKPNDQLPLVTISVTLKSVIVGCFVYSHPHNKHHHKI